MLAIVVHVPVAGSHISDVYTGLVGFELGPSGPLDPPVTNTLPSGSKVALWSLRPPAMAPVYSQAGVDPFKSMISAVAVGSVVQVPEYGAHVLPPMSNTLPSSYITDEPQLRTP